MTTPSKEKEMSASDKNKMVENHKKTATHLEEASKHHKDAAKHAESDNHEMAAKSTLKAHGHTSHAIEHQKESVKNHANM